MMDSAAQAKPREKGRKSLDYVETPYQLSPTN